MGGIVDVVFLYAEGIDGFRAYQGPLPEGLSWEHKSCDVVSLLGEPSDKFGGGRIPVSISYETKGLDVSFIGKNWDDASNPIAFLSIFPQKDQFFDLCLRCGKRARYNCSSCRAVRYCSSACQKQDWPSHQSQCCLLRQQQQQQQ